MSSCKWYSRQDVVILEKISEIHNARIWESFCYYTECNAASLRLTAAAVSLFEIKLIQDNEAIEAQELCLGCLG